MKTKNNLLNWLTALTMIVAMTFSSCKKDNSLTAEEPQDPATMEAVADDVTAETEYDDVFNIAMGVSSTDVGENIGLGAGIGLGGRTSVDGGRTNAPDSHRCFTVTVSPLTPGVFPKTVTTDFGNGCLGRDGRLRKGKIVTVYTGHMVVPGKKATTTFINYHVDSFKIEGIHITENTSTSNMLGWSVKVIDGKVTNTVSNRWRKWDSEKNILQIEGNGTNFFPLDDVFRITGGARGSNSGGHTWSSIIVEPLIKKFNCRWIVKGIVRITRDNKVALLNYGNGSCDNQAVITINGVSHTVTLH